ncbi:unnamed protein product [Pocillopora meandrina]|uniref:DED domain-containing protein n=1 Tax=Pocillopora meandrina TaxID=46732 RepID=A0AAU9VVE3_9CNID|nr:unnamed protein product [Pocillopora meandrina]
MSSFDLVCPEDDLYDESLSKESLSEAGQDSLDTMLEFIQHSSLSVAEAAFNQLTQGEYAGIEPLANSFSKPQAGSERLSSEEENEISKEDFPNTETSCESVNQANEWEHLGARPKHRPPKKFNNSLDSSSPVDLIPPQVVEPAAHGVHNPLLPEHLEDKKVGHEYWEWMASDEVGLLSRLPDTETRETLKDIPQHTQFSFLLDQINELKEKVEQLTKEVKLQEEEILALKLQRREKNIFQPHTEDIRECEPCATRGSSSDFYHKKGNLRSFRHHRLIEISNSLSESELQRLKGLVQPKLDSFRLAKIREGSELFQELESRGELSCTSVRDLLEKIHRFDLAEKLGSSSHGSDELSE